MEMGGGNHKTVGPYFARRWGWLSALPDSLLKKMVQVARETKKVGEDDPRRVIHSLKLGLALTLVSLLYYFQPLYDSFGVSAMWAVMTVVLVFEFSVGATIGKGLNRALATLLAGALAVGAHHLASMCGKIGEPIVLGFIVFTQAAASTFVRFFPQVNARYDYGLLIFILTFCLISVSGFRTDEILELAHRRLSTILIGASTCVIVSILVCPVWAGEDLHNLVANNIEKLGNFLEGFGDEYFKSSENEETNKDGRLFLLQGYKSVLNSKNTEDALANFARWEPGHGLFKFRHPWKQYLKVGTLSRECACRIEALNGYLQDPMIKARHNKINGIIQEACTRMSVEAGKALKELAFAVKTITTPSSSANPYITNSKIAAKDLDNALLKAELWKELELLQVMHVAAVVSLLNDVILCVENIANAVNELACFQNVESNLMAQKKLPSDQCPHVVNIPVNETTSASQEYQSKAQLHTPLAVKG